MAATDPMAFVSARHRLLDVAALVRQPDATSEPVLLCTCNSLERLVEDAFQSVCNDSINVLDQIRINSFLQRPSATDRPLPVKLQISTWRHYTRIWKDSFVLSIDRRSRVRRSCYDISSQADKQAIYTVSLLRAKSWLNYLQAMASSEKKLHLP